MNSKLTLRLEDDLIRSAKRYSSKSGKSLSRLVADYFTVIEAGEGGSGTGLPPRVRSLFGALAGSSASEQDYRRHFEAKHR